MEPNSTCQRSHANGATNFGVEQASMSLQFKAVNVAMFVLLLVLVLESVNHLCYLKQIKQRLITTSTRKKGSH